MTLTLREMVAHRRTVPELVNSKGTNSVQKASDDPISWSSNNKASTPYHKQCAQSGSINWSYSSLIGTRNQDHYLAALDLLLKSRQECYRMRKTKSFWKNYALKMSELAGEEFPITPSPSDISVTNVRQNVIYSHYPVDNARHLVLPDCVAESIVIMKSGDNHYYANDRHVGESQHRDRVKLDGCEIVGGSSSHEVTSDSFCDITGSTQVDCDESSLSDKTSLQRSWNSSLSIKQYSDIISDSDMEANLATEREKNTLTTCIDRNESSTTTPQSTSNDSHKVSKVPLPLAPKRDSCKTYESLTKATKSPLCHGSTPTQEQSSLLPISSARRSALNRYQTATNPLPRAKCFPILMK